MLVEYLNLNLIEIIDNISEDKEKTLKKMIENISKYNSSLKDKELFYKEILEREKVGTTGIGMGIAVPHARTEGLDDIVISVALLKKPLDFKSLDGENIRLIILVGAPKNPNKKYLEVLSDIARVFRNKRNRESIFASQTKDQLIEAIAELEE